MRREHLEFLEGVGNPYVGVGLQSFDNEVLAHVERRYDEARFQDTLNDLGRVANLAVEIILGSRETPRSDFVAITSAPASCPAR